MLKKYKSALFVICLSIIFSSLLISCTDTKKTVKATTSSAKSAVSEQSPLIKKPVWTYNLILTYNGYKYKVTKETTKDIDSLLGAICYHGKEATGFQLYSIKNVKNYDKIAVDTKDGYLIAIKGNKYSLTP